MTAQQLADRIRTALDCAHPVTGDDHDAVDEAEALLAELVALAEEREQLRAAAERYLEATKNALLYPSKDTEAEAVTAYNALREALSGSSVEAKEEEWPARKE